MGPTPNQSMREKGYSQFLRKPIRATSLLHTLSQALEKLEKFERLEKEKLEKFEKPLEPSQILGVTLPEPKKGKRILGLTNQLRRSGGVERPSNIEPKSKLRNSTNNFSLSTPLTSSNNNTCTTNNHNIININRNNMFSRRQSLLTSWENVRFEEESEEQDSFYTGIDGLEILIVEGILLLVFVRFHYSNYFADNPINQKVVKRVSFSIFLCLMFIMTL